jgi:beta-glucosidase
LSYTTFDYSALGIDASDADWADHGLQIRVSCTVANTGYQSGEEVVQLYISDLTSTITTYESRLCGFERVSLESGESKAVEFLVGFDEISLLNRDDEWVVEPGEFQVMVGSSSADIRLTGRFEL